MEIGSEFWLEKLENKNSNWTENKNEILLMSGRTAIDLAINTINRYNRIKRVYMPSYCCESMLVAFRENNIEIEFYNVIFQNGKLIYDIDTNKCCDIFFAMNYFGFSSYNMDEYIEKFKARNITVLEDSTHSFLSKRKYNDKSDIVIASLRKWFPIISGAILILNNKKYIGSLEELKKYLTENEEYSNLKEKAMLQKSKYIKEDKSIDKNIFLNNFKQSNEILKLNFKNHKIDYKSKEILKQIDKEEVIKARRKNAKMIYEFLNKQKKVNYLKDVDFENDTPLFIPIFLEGQERDKLKKYLVQNNIFCPIHWPIPSIINSEKQKEIYNMELSLICDQRYSEKDILSYINLINI